MDVVIRGRRSLLIAALAGAVSVLVIACAGRSGDGSAIGASDKRASGGSVRRDPDAGFVDGAGALPVGYRTSFTKVNLSRFVSQGHAGGRWEVDVWANGLAERALAARSREVPVGAIVVEEHYERGADGAAYGADAGPNGPIMVMEKKSAGFSKEHGDWRWAVVGSRGQLVRDGVVETCAGCHDDAPMDGLFPIVP